MYLNKIGFLNPNFRKGTVFWYNQFPNHKNKKIPLLINGIKTHRELGYRPYVIVSSDRFNSISSIVMASPIGTGSVVFQENSRGDIYHLQFNGSSDRFLNTIHLDEIVSVDKEFITEETIMSSCPYDMLAYIDECMRNVLFGSGPTIVEDIPEQQYVEEEAIEESNEEEIAATSTILPAGTYGIDKEVEKQIPSAIDKFNKRLKKSKELQEKHENKKEEMEYHLLAIMNFPVTKWEEDTIKIFKELETKMTPKEMATLIGVKSSVIYAKRAKLKEIIEK